MFESTTMLIFLAVWGPGIMKLLGITLGAGVLLAIYNIVR